MVKASSIGLRNIQLILVTQRLNKELIGSAILKTFITNMIIYSVDGFLTSLQLVGCIGASFVT